MKNKKIIKRFILMAIATLFLTEAIEFVIKNFFNIDEELNLEIAWLGATIMFLFKSHLLCCILPAIWVTYKCRHKEDKQCDHDHCS